MREIYMLCNAHLDPVWLWQRQEGMAEAISTFRVAADFCEKYEGFIFNHNESVLYEWVEEYEPALFKRIKKLVKEGKWRIMGGWYLQPDCVMPSGESFIRQIEVGNEYFENKFGVKSETAVNFDPFGHNRGLVQILAKKGYKNYLFVRPLAMVPEQNFIWKGYEGSEVIGHNVYGTYNSPKGRVLERVTDMLNNPNEKCLLCWGVGNHGGGPSEEDWKALCDYQKEHPEIKMIPCGCEEYFDKVDKTVLRTIENSLVHCMVGCYTSMVRIKQKHRLLENELAICEKMLAASEVSYDKKELKEAEKALLFSEFHDSLPGTMVKRAEEDMLRQMDYGREIIAKNCVKAFFKLCEGQPVGKRGEIPVLVFNPNPYWVEQEVEVEFQLEEQNFNVPEVTLARVRTPEGEYLPTQNIKEDCTFNLDWRKRIVFRANLKPMSMSRFDCELYTIDEAKRPIVACGETETHFFFENDRMKASINKETGLLVTGQEEEWWKLRSYILTNGTLEFRSSLNGVTMTPDINFTSSDWESAPTLVDELLTVRMAFDKVDDTTMTVDITVTVGGVPVTKKATLTGASSLIYNESGYTFVLREYVESDDITIGSVGNEPERTYTELTFRDWYLMDTTYTSAQSYRKSDLTSLDGVAITGDIIFANDGAHKGICLEPTDEQWETFQIYRNGTTIEVRSFDSTKPLSTDLDFAAADLRVTDLSTTPVTVRMCFDKVDDSTMELTVKMTVGTKSKTQKTTFTGTGVANLISYSDGYVLGTGAQTTNLTLASTEKEMTKENGYYNIETEPYFLMSTGTVQVNDETKEPGSVINQAGDYVIVTDQSGLKVQQNVSLYIVGDVNLSDSTNDVALTTEDVTELEAILNEPSLMTAAQEKAADLNNDGTVDKFDLEVLKNIVDGKNSRAAVMEKYYPKAITYDYLGGNSVMPIIGYRGPSDALLTDSTFDLIDKAGINMFNYLPTENMTNPGAVLKELELAEKYGMGVFVTDATINHMIRSESDSSVVTSVDTATGKELAGLLSRYSYFNSYLGNYIWDEPTLPNQASDEIEESSERNLAWHEDIATELNGYANTNGYLNVAAGYWFKESGIAGLLQKDLTEANIEEYENVVKTITENSNAKVLSFDRYLRDVDTVLDCERYFLNLDIIRNQAIASDIPFWAYAPLGGGWNTGGDIPTTAEFYWQVNMGLAFGAKGIQYYAMTPAEGTETTNGVGLLNTDGTANSTWYTPVQNINAQINAVDEVLMRADSLGIITSGGYAKNNTTDISVQTGSTSATTTNYQLAATTTYDKILFDDKVQCIESIDGETENKYGVLTGVFNYRGKIALYVVNYDTVTPAGQKVTVSFTDDYRYRTIDASGEMEYVGESCEYKLAPGQAVLIVLDSLVGDADRSVALTSQDLVRYKKMEQNVADADFAYEYAADLNCDKQINKTDTIWTRWKLVGYMVKDIPSL